MPFFHLLLLAVIQGLTEFLPISSSGHLALFSQVAGVEDQGLAIDVAVHVGSLLAVILYFRAQVGRAIAGGVQLLRGKMSSQEAQLALGLIIATIPAVIFGLFLKVSGLDEAMRSVAVIGWTMLIFGVVLYWADQHGGEGRNDNDWMLKDALLMGMAQCLALIPGTSRAGITITAGRFLNYDRESAATLSMLMSIPVIIATGTLLSVDVIQSANWELARDAAIAAVFAFLAALAALALMFRLLKAVSFTPYVIYRVLLGIGLLVWAYA